MKKYSSQCLKKLLLVNEAFKVDTQIRGMVFNNVHGFYSFPRKAFDLLIHNVEP